MTSPLVAAEGGGLGVEPGDRSPHRPVVLIGWPVGFL